MNERYAVSPKFFRNELELRYLLEKFGPYTGRYVAEFPGSWRRQAILHAEDAGDVEKVRIIERLRRHRGAFVPSGHHYDPCDSWPANVRRLQKNASPFFRVIADRLEPGGFATIDEVDADFFPSSDACRIEGSAREYERACAPFLAVSRQVVLVDPYFKANMINRVRVLKPLVQAAVRSGCEAMTIVARAADVVSDSRPFGLVLQEARERLRGIPRPRLGLTYRLVDDSASRHRMHMRYLVGTSGALRMDVGFEEQPGGRLVDVSIVPKTLHEELLELHFDGRHDFMIVYEDDLLPG